MFRGVDCFYVSLETTLYNTMLTVNVIHLFKKVRLIIKRSNKKTTIIFQSVTFELEAINTHLYLVPKMFISFTNIHTTFQNVIQSKKKNAIESSVAPPGAVRYKIDSTQGYKPVAAASRVCCAVGKCQFNYRWRILFCTLLEICGLSNLTLLI